MFFESPDTPYRVDTATYARIIYIFVHKQQWRGARSYFSEGKLPRSRKNKEAAGRTIHGADFGPNKLDPPRRIIRLLL